MTLTHIKYYTYIHYRLDTMKPFYVGKGIGKRYKVTRGRNDKWNKIVNKHGFQPKILAYWDTEQQALDHEMLLISVFRELGYDLTNMTDGGDNPPTLRGKDNPMYGKGKFGADNPMYGKKRSDVSARNKLVQRKIISGEDHWAYGTTNEQLKAYNDSHKGANHPRYGTKHSAESIAKNIASNKIQVHCPHCNKQGGKSIMKRWHFDKCKQYKAQ